MANVLVIGPHPDDQELGMGGTIALLASQGHRVLLLDMTNGEPTPHGSPEVRALEAEAAARALSGPGHEVRRVQLGLRNRYVEHSVEARHRVAGVIRAHRTDIMFVPHPDDAHPDHRAVTRIAEDARFDAKLTQLDMPVPEGIESGQPVYPTWLFHYFATHLRSVPSPSFLVDVSAFMEHKMRSIAAYESQFHLNPKNRHVPDWVRAQAVYFGSRAGVAAAEAFSAPEPLALRSFDGLV